MMLMNYSSGGYVDPNLSAYRQLHKPSNRPSEAPRFELHRDATGAVQSAAAGGASGQVGAGGRHNTHNQHHHHQPGQSNARRGHRNSHGPSKSHLSQHQQHIRKWKTPLQDLVDDERNLHQRKQNIGRFGATWIRPPGVPKTYQAMMDEAAERAEQEALALREAAALAHAEAANAANAAAMAAANAARGLGDGDLGAGMDLDQEDRGFEQERDLDDEVPEADEMDFDLDDMDEEEEEEEEEGLVDEEDEDEEQLRPGFADEERDEGPRDLDDDIPEAGSYQHTDTEAEDASSSSDLDLSLHQHRQHLHSGRHRLSSIRGAIGTPSRAIPTPTSAPAPIVPVTNALRPPNFLDSATGQFIGRLDLGARGDGIRSPREELESSLLLSSPTEARSGVRGVQSQLQESQGSQEQHHPSPGDRRRPH